MSSRTGRSNSAIRKCTALVVVLQAAGCSALLGDPYAEIGAVQDAQNRKVNAQYPASLPDKLRTDYEARARGIGREERAAEWLDFWDLFRPRLARVPFRDEPGRCPVAGQYLSCSALQGCACRVRPPALEGAAPK